jgi:hypothetical protein
MPTISAKLAIFQVPALAPYGLDIHYFTVTWDEQSLSNFRVLCRHC